MVKILSLFSVSEDFCPSDVESYEEIFDVLSELEEKRIEVFKDLLGELETNFKKRNC